MSDQGRQEPSVGAATPAQRCVDCKNQNGLLLALSGHLDKVSTERAYDGVECVRLRIVELEAELAALRASAPRSGEATTPQGEK